ncbi:hypothetical protein ACFVTC_42315 [Streptomyces sp. NPDC057950]|uniref:hypothetical protein n=1 Tax=Streptomyces sp. NPDC057950 TaxID=3346288 RepID=UPI0036EB649F
MSYPEDPFPALPAEQAELFAAAAAGYDRYRPGVPAEAAELLADTLRDLPDPTLLDLGTGTGQVPKALLKALPSPAHIEGVDWSQQIASSSRCSATEPSTSPNQLRPAEESRPLGQSSGRSR